jgi:hypothetical protein
MIDAAPAKPQFHRIELTSIYIRNRRAAPQSWWTRHCPRRSAPIGDREAAGLPAGRLTHGQGDVQTSVPSPPHTAGRFPPQRGTYLSKATA